MHHDAEDSFSFPALPPAARQLIREFAHFLNVSGDQYVSILASELKLCRTAAGLEQPALLRGG